MIRVLIVDDSLTTQLHIKHLLSDDPEMQVVAVAFNGEEAVEANARFKPDLILMDIQMPKMNGIEATQRIMTTQPVPIVIVSTRASDAEMALRGVAVGALSVQEKPPGIGHPDYEAVKAKFLQGLRQMAGVKVVRRWTLGAPTPLAPTPSPASPAPPRRPRSSADNKEFQPLELVAVGASTGGPPVLKTIFERFTPAFPVPILVVQHIATGFLPGMVTWLSGQISLPVRIAAHGEKPLAGHVYLAPDSAHLAVNSEHRLVISTAPPERGLRPAVSCLFRSVAQHYGARAAGVLLTGMGKDGAEELGLMHDQGAPTIAQDQETSIVHGMPGEAIRLGATSWVLPPDDIAATLLRLTNKRSSG
jgi:two-component system, chemotaxis family, protein-glutamate methylesterase/glutaminase